ncbi:HET domain containing protein [Seiridium cupressi]
MRLLNAESYRLEEFVGANIPPYAILSHTWEDGEVLYEVISDLETARTRDGFWKIERCCAEALNDGWEWVWIDTCCIDKSSSAELSEAINSMFHWYKHAMVCYAYLSDIDSRQNLEARLEDMAAHLARSSPASPLPCRWFYRSWTLQELIAPRRVQFFGKEWAYLGSKNDLKPLLSKATGIDPSILSHALSLHEKPAGDKMRWAAYRQATRVEDLSYSLLGLFDVNMPLLYGEGRKAFYRLQEHILTATDGHTLLSFGLSPWAPDRPVPRLTDVPGLIAQSPKDFRADPMVRRQANIRWSQSGYVNNLQAGRPRLRIHLPVRKLTPRDIRTLKLDRKYVWNFAALNLYAWDDLYKQVHRAYSTGSGNLMQTISSQYFDITLLFVDLNAKGLSGDSLPAVCFVISQYVLISPAETLNWKVQPLNIVSYKVPIRTYDQNPGGLPTIVSSQSMSSLATTHGLRIIDSETWRKTQTLERGDRYWLLTGFDKPILAYFKFMRYTGGFIYRIERTAPDASPKDILYRWRWSENQKHMNYPNGTGLLWEDRFSLDPRFDAVFSVAGRASDAGFGVIKVYFRVQDSMVSKI